MAEDRGLAVNGTRVVNLHDEPYDVYIGRPGPWGNPFRIGEIYKGWRLSREGAIGAFRYWFETSDQGQELKARLHELEGKRLGCYCKPAACHGDVLVAAVARRQAEREAAGVLDGDAT